MPEVNKLVKLPEGSFNANVIEYTSQDRVTLAKIYNLWRQLSEHLIAQKGRAINIPEALSEGAFCLEMNCYRFIERLNGAVTSFDAYDPVSHNRIQVKACAVTNDLTSFGPNSVWDKIYFCDFYRDGNWDGTFDIYLIPNEFIYNHKVNRNQTMKDQQEQGRRPRFSIKKEIIFKQNISPFKTARLF